MHHANNNSLRGKQIVSRWPISLNLLMQPNPYATGLDYLQ